MFHSRKLNSRIDKLHEQAPNLDFRDLLVSGKSFCIHHRNLQKLAIKIKHNCSPTLVQELFPTYENIHNLRSNRCWQTENVDGMLLHFRGQKT